MNSQPYSVAKHFLLSNVCLRRDVGAVKGLQLAYFAPYDIRGGAIKGEATLSIRAQGERSNATVVLTLVKDLGEWSIVSAIVKNDQQRDSSDDLSKCHQM